jgi:ABC-2 type transport system permease protein
VNNILVDLKASIKSFYRNKSAIFWTVAFPSVLILLFGAIFSQSAIRYDLYLQNQDLVDGKPSYWSGLLINTINSTDVFNLKVIKQSVNATSYAIDNRLAVLLAIPEGFNSSANLALASGGSLSAKTSIVYDQSSSSSPVSIGIVSGIVEKLNFELSQGNEFFILDSVAIAPEQFGFIDFFMPGIIAVTAMTSSIFPAVSVSARFKENGVFHKLATTTVRRYEWILSRTLFNILISYLGMGVLIVLGVLVFNLKLSVDVVSLLLVAMASLFFTGLGMVISRFVRDPDGADAAANVVTFPMMFLSGTFFELSQMPEFLQTIAKFLPLTYVAEGLRASMIFGQNEQAIVNLILVTVMGLVAIVVGSLITKWETD